MSSWTKSLPDSQTLYISGAYKQSVSCCSPNNYRRDTQVKWTAGYVLKGFLTGIRRVSEK